MIQMKCRAILVVGLFLSSQLNFGQVGINSTGTAPNTSAMLDVSSNNKGLLIPRMTQAERDAISNPADGLIIFQTDNNPGLYYYRGTMSPNWNLVGNNAGQWQTNSSNIYYNAGNVGIGTSSPNAKLEVSGSDGIIHELTVGRGAGSISSNTVLGYGTLPVNSTGYNNTAIGASAMNDNSTGYENTALGANSLSNNTTAIGNTAIGYLALNSVTTGGYSTAVGGYTLTANKTHYNVAVGFWTLKASTYAQKNIAIGPYALAMQSFSNGNTPFNSNNIAIGYEALTNNNPTTTYNGIDNVAVGYRCLYSNTTGFSNIASGNYSLHNNTTGYANTALGFDALFQNTFQHSLVAVGDSALYHNGTGASGTQQAHRNTAVGSKALYGNTTGSGNTAIGNEALRTNTEGDRLVAVGSSALRDNLDGDDNVAIGAGALAANTIGIDNIALGTDALFESLSGERNIAIGTGTLKYNETNDNIAIGNHAMIVNHFATQNIAIGTEALNNISYTNGDVSYAGNNIAIGYEVLHVANPTASNNGINNNAIGYHSMLNTSTGYGNTGFGHSTLSANTTGDYNTAVGFVVLNDLGTGDYTTAVGYNAGPTSSFPDPDNSTALGNGCVITADDQIRLGNSSVTSIGGYQNWSNISDARFKVEVSDNIPGLAFINQLHPVSYRLDRKLVDDFTGMSEKRARLAREYSASEDDEDAPQLSEIRTGFIAQEVEDAAKRIGFEFSGVDAPKNEHDIYGLRYAEFVVPLVKAVQEQQVIIEELQKKNEELLRRIEKLETKN